MQAWEHGAKVLIIAGEDDQQVDPRFHELYVKNWPSEWKHNVQLIKYPGAGHLLEPPYMPHIRSSAPGRKRMATIQFVPEKFHGISF